MSVPTETLNGALTLDQLRNIPEQFLANSPDGNSKPFRELNDKELIELNLGLQKQFSDANTQLQKVMNDVSALAQFIAVTKFEMERRAKSIRIASVLS